VNRLWVGTTALGVIGLLAAPTLVGTPVLLADMWGDDDAQPFVILLTVLYMLSLGWLLLAVFVALKHRGRNRKIVLGGLAGMMFLMLALTFIGPKQTVSIKIDIPPPVGGSSK